MSRVIKFRAWDSKNDEMRDWDYVRSNWTLGILNGDSSTAIMQFTGILDAKGREIYEGDVVRDSDEMTVIEYGFQDVDAFIGIGFNLWPFKNDPDLEGNYEHQGSALREYEVIGNLYENPNLLTP